MAWTPETIIALVTLLVTSPSTFLIVWKYIRRKRRCTGDKLQRGESPCTSTPSSDLRPSRCTCVHPEVALEMGLYREGIFMPTYTHVPPRNSMTRPWPSYCGHEPRFEISPASTARPVREWD
ncbi:hypothetical protein AFLA_014000 [Aspergillus flavus NRRL3357]|nr:hypothetical protein AFLA_014000 [Aspergillus flavus NRRL3357]